MQMTRVSAGDDLTRGELGVFDLTWVTENYPEVTRSIHLTTGPDDVEAAWVPMLNWMKRAGLECLLVCVYFIPGKPTKAFWSESGPNEVWVDVAGTPPSRNDATAWGLAIARFADAALLALSRHFDAGPPPLIPRTPEEQALEASGAEPATTPMTIPLLPEHVRPASSARLWEEVDFYIASGAEELQRRWEGLDSEMVMSLQAAGAREVGRWVKAAAKAEDEDSGEDRELQAVQLMRLGRRTYDAAVRNPAPFLDCWPEEGEEELLVAFGI